MRNFAVVAAQLEDWRGLLWEDLARHNLRDLFADLNSMLNLALLFLNNVLRPFVLERLLVLED